MTGNRYVAMLRAINLGGHSVMTMATLKKAFEDLGFADAVTVGASGNVVFTASSADRAALAKKIAAKLKAVANYDTTVFVRTAADLKNAAAANPFEPEKREKTQRCHLLFMASKPTVANVKKLMGMTHGQYRFAVKGDVFYYAYDKKFDGKARARIDFEKVLGVVGTARTWKVVDTLIGMLEK